MTIFCTCPTASASYDTKGKTGRFGIIQKYTIDETGVYLIKAGGARGGTHSYNYNYKPGTYYGGKGATMEGKFRLTAGTVLRRGGVRAVVRSLPTNPEVPGVDKMSTSIQGLL